MPTTYPLTRWKIGAVTITRIIEIEGSSPGTFFFEHATPEALLQHAWLRPHFLTAEGRAIASVHAFVIESEGRAIIVDTCIGNDKPREVKAWNLRQGRFLADLAEAGFPREKIDTVLCTHLHVDHVGWNTMLVDGKWLPTFPNARYLVAEPEWRYWDANEDDKTYGTVLADSVRPVVDAGLVDFVDVRHRVCDEVWLEPTPGHTPGHVSVHIASEGKEALITGDCIHHPVQMARTDWCSSADYDRDQGRRTREALLAKYADTDVLVIGTHYATPCAGYVVSGAGGFTFRARA